MVKHNNILQRTICFVTIFFLYCLFSNIARASSDVGTATISIQPTAPTIGINVPTTINITPAISTTPEEKGISGITVVVGLDAAQGKAPQVTEDDIELQLSSPWTTLMKEVKTDGSKTTISASLLYFAPGDAPAASIPVGTSILSIKFIPQSVGSIKVSIDPTASSIVAASDNSDILKNQSSSINIPVVAEVKEAAVTKQQKQSSAKKEPSVESTPSNQSYEYGSEEISLDQQVGTKPAFVNNVVAIIVAVILIACIGGGMYMYSVAQKTKTINIKTESMPIILKKELLPSQEELKH